MKNPFYKIFDLEYKNDEIRYLIHIFKRTKKRRIKNKLFNKLFFMCLNEKGIIKLDDLVLLRYDIYSELIQSNENLKQELEKYSKT